MSDVLVAALDNQRSERTIIAGSSATAVFTVQPNVVSAKALGLLICNASAGGVNYTVDIHDGSTAYIVKKVVSLASNASDYVDLRGTRMAKSETIRVTAAADVHVIADVLEHLR